MARTSRRARGAIVVAVVVTLAAVGAMRIPHLEVDNGLDRWVSGSSPAALAYVRSQQAFGGAREVVVAWAAADPRGELALARGQALASRLAAVQGVNRALSLADLLAGLEIEPGELPEDAWQHPYLRASFAGDHVAALWLEVDGDAPQETTDDLVACLAADEHAGGAPVLNRALDRAAREAPALSLPWMVGVTILAMAVVAWRTRARRPWLMLALPAAGGGVAVAVALGVMSVSGARLDLVTTAVPGVTWVIGFAAAVHVAFALERGHPPATVARGVMWSAATTSAGLLSLSVTGVRSLTAFGLVTACGVIAAAAFAVGLLYSWPRTREPAATSARVSDAPLSAPGLRRAGATIALGIGVLAGAGVARLGSGSTPLDLLPEADRARNDARWIEEHLTGLMPVEVLLEGGELEARQLASRQLARGLVEDGVASGAWSGLDLEELPDTELGKLLVAKHEAHGLSLVRVRASSKDDEALSRIRDAVARRVGMRAGDSAWPAGVEATVTGVVPLIVDLQQQLLDAQVRSLSLIAPVLAVCLVIVTRSLALTAMALVVNLLPAAVVLGLLGWSGRGLDPATAMVAAIAIGIAVDDTIHLLVHEREAALGGLAAPAAMAVAWRRALPAITTTTLVLVAGFTTFVAAPFAPVADFGVLTAVALATAWIADLLILPVLVELRAGARGMTEESAP